ncbi:MAG: hypothetical protein ABW182_01055, partial [Sphingomonas sp.]
MADRSFLDWPFLDDGHRTLAAALEGVCVGAGAIVAMASDMRIAHRNTKTAFLFTRVGLAGCDM